MSHGQFAEKVDVFFSRLLAVAQEDADWMVARTHIEWLDHKRTVQISIWTEATSARQEFGHIFQLRSQKHWDNDNVPWAKVLEILKHTNWAIGPFETSRVWEVHNLAEQSEPLNVCYCCGQEIGGWKSSDKPS